MSTEEQVAKILRYAELSLKEAHGQTLTSAEAAQKAQIPVDLGLTHDEIVERAEHEIHRRY